VTLTEEGGQSGAAITRTAHRRALLRAARVVTPAAARRALQAAQLACDQAAFDARELASEVAAAGAAGPPAGAR
jgi:hypothetical protein